MLTWTCRVLLLFGLVVPGVTVSAWAAPVQLETGWETLGPRLAGKLHIYVAREDTFLLDRPARLFAEALAKLKSDALVEFVDGNHFSVADNAALRSRINDHMDKTLATAFPTLGTKASR